MFTRLAAYWEKTRTRYRKSRQERYVWKVSDAIGRFLERFFHFDRPFERSSEVHEPRNAMKLSLSAKKFRILGSNPDQEVLRVPDDFRLSQGTLEVF